MAKGNFLRSLRQLTLLLILLGVAGGSFLSRSRVTSWEESLWVTVYPIAGDDSAATDKYIAGLTPKTFAAIETFMRKESERYGVDITRPVRIDVGRPITEEPPAPPESRNPLMVAFWSIKLRWWASAMTSNQPGAEPNIRLFLVYHDPDRRSSVPHSLGLQKGMLGVAHVFANRKMQSRNNVVIAHEMLHTIGAQDKYSGEANMPLPGIGFAEPDRAPLYPQRYAEIMGGRIPISADEAVMPKSLKLVRVGAATALEIRWIDTLKKKPVG